MPQEKLNRVIYVLREALKDKVPNVDQKINEQLDIFRNSEAVVVCEDCATIFYSGFAKVIAETKKFVDWKMLAFRHVWDTHHKVVIFMPYFGLSMFSMSHFNPLIDPQDNTKILYYQTVERLRQNRPDRAKRSFDENWKDNDTCYCSVCGKRYFNPKDACYCCFESKPFLPKTEIETIRVE